MGDGLQREIRSGESQSTVSDVLATATAHGSAPAINIVLSADAIKPLIWIVVAGILVIGLLAAYAAVKAESAYDKAQEADTFGMLIYSHQLKLEAMLAAHGFPVDEFDKISPPKKDRSP